MFGKSIFFFYKALLFGLSAYLVIPRAEFKKFFIFGFFFGGIGDIIVIVILSNLNLIAYKNMGPFSIWGLFSFWTPIAWLFAFMLFFLFLTGTEKVFLSIYLRICTFCAYGGIGAGEIRSLSVYGHLYLLCSYCFYHLVFFSGLRLSEIRTYFFKF